ncbi:MAG: phospholipase D-like domain-containing protein, partial [Bdellovibrionota bacterium]
MDKTNLHSKNVFLPWCLYLIYVKALMNQKFPFKKRVFSQLAGRCLLISTVLLAVKSPAKAAVEAVFNTPGFKGAATTTVEDKIISLIRGAPAGSLIRASQYRFGRENVANEFIQASQRGVDVRFIFDGNLKDHLLNSDHPLSKLVTQLKCEDHSCITFCSHGSCQGIHINHNKFILFSELDNGQKNIVAQTSSNLEEAQLHNYNDLVVVSENNSLYENFLKYWSKLQDDRFRINIKNSAPGDEMVSAYFFPVLIGRDPVLKVLKKTECHLPGSKIR